MRYHYTRPTVNPFFAESERFHWCGLKVSSAPPSSTTIQRQGYGLHREIPKILSVR
jgi:hypothetical protein